MAPEEGRNVRNKLMTIALAVMFMIKMICMGISIKLFTKNVLPKNIARYSQSLYVRPAVLEFVPLLAANREYTGLVFYYFLVPLTNALDNKAKQKFKFLNTIFSKQ